MKHITTLIYICAGLVAISSTGCRSDKKQQTGTEIPAVSVALPEVDSVVLHQSYPAQLTATKQADAVARVNGKIIAKHYTDGQRVKAGQPLFTIESTTYRNQLQQAQAQLETAQAQHDYATRQCAAMKKALEANAVSRMDVVQAESSVRESEAAINTARAAISDARTQLGYCTVTAPISGKVSAALFDVGDYIGGEGAPVKVATVVDDSRLYVNFSIEDSRYLAMTETAGGHKVDYNHVPVTFGDTIARTCYGPVDYTGPAVDPSTGTMAMRVILDNKDGQLRSGMFATVQFPYAVEPHAILIKDASIGTDQLGKYVYVVNDSDKVVYTPIKIGELYDDTLRIVNSGLAPDARYVTSAMMKVRDGMPVKPVSPTAKGTPAKR